MHAGPLPYRRRLISVDGVDLHYAELGTGRPTVLLHGLADSHRTWNRVAPLLARSRRVLLLDLAGHGLSARPNASYALAWHARLVAAWMNALGLDQVDLVGHSFGGGVAQWLLLYAPGRVRRLALVAAGGLGQEVGWGVRFCSVEPVVAGFGQPFMPLGTRLALATAKGAFDDRDVAYQCWVNSMPGSARALSRSASDVVDLCGQRRHLLDHLGEVAELPAISLFWGDDDPIIPLSHGQWAASFLEGAVLARFAGCGHFPHRERPVEFASALAAFAEAPGLRAARPRWPKETTRLGRSRRESFLSRVCAAVRRLFRRPKPARHEARPGLALPALG